MTTRQALSYCGIILLLAATIIFGCRCSTSKPTPDPLAGWQFDSSEEPGQIVSDYQNYIQQLPEQERRVATVDYYLKDGTGQHAIKITTGVDKRNWRHILIYDKNNRRIKVIKYADGYSQS